MKTEWRRCFEVDIDGSFAYCYTMVKILEKYI